MAGRHEVEAAYRSAHYRVDTADGPLLLRVGEPSVPLARLLHQARAQAAALLTAANPASEPLSPAVNQQRNAALLARLVPLGYTLLPSAGVDPAGIWPEEPGVFVIGIPCSVATELARQSGQLAFLWCGAGRAPELVWPG